MKRLLVSTLSLLVAFGAPPGRVAAGSVVAAAAPDLRLLPRPASLTLDPGCAFSSHRGLALAANADPGARELLDERWGGLGFPATRIASGGSVPDVRVSIARGEIPQSYRLRVSANGVRIQAADADGAFYAFATLAQLARKTDGAFALPCVEIEDAPALRWRILSDDVSRGPLPTMRYFEERIRTIAAFKMNGYSPYMEHVFVDPKHPLPAPFDGITSDQLRELNRYAKRFHVALIPEQQTFAHMHNTLRWERYAALAETPHGWLLTPANPEGERYVRDLIDDELAAVPNPPFFHVGSDEPSDLGRERSKELVERQGDAGVYQRHVLAVVNDVIENSDARPMIWDDALSRHPDVFSDLPRSLVVVNWHYGAEKSFVPYIKRIADAGFDQMVAPGDANWNEIYPDLDTALANINRFTSEGKAMRVLGLFQTVWNDDGETLFEETWYPVIYAAASGWERGSVDRARFATDFPWAFFGSNDRRYAEDFADLARARSLLHESGDTLFWADPFDPAVFVRASKSVDFVALRLAAERAIEHLRVAPPAPLHANAAAVMELAARRYDALGRDFEIAQEARADYEDAVSRLRTRDDDTAQRELLETKYLFWEQRDMLLDLELLMRSAWSYENRPSHELSVLERYHLVAGRAILRADAAARVAAEARGGRRALPSFDQLLAGAEALP